MAGSLSGYSMRAFEVAQVIDALAVDVVLHVQVIDRRSPLLKTEAC